MEMTLREVGLMLVEASKKVPKEKRASFQALKQANAFGASRHLYRGAV